MFDIILFILNISRMELVFRYENGLYDTSKRLVILRCSTMSECFGKRRFLPLEPL